MPDIKPYGGQPDDHGPNPGRRGPGSVAGAFSSLSIPQFRWFVASLASSSMAFQAQLVVRGWLAYDLTRSPLAVGIVVGVWGLPMLFLSPFGGLLADQMNRRHIMMAMQATSAVTALIIAVLLTRGNIALWHLVIAGVVDGTAISFDMPSRNAFVFDVVGREYIASAAGLHSGVANTMRLLAPSLTGVLIGEVGVEAVYYMIVAFYLISVATVFFWVRNQSRENRQRRTSAVKDLAGGFKYVWGNRVVFWLLVLGLFTGGLGLPFRNLMPAFAVEILGQGAKGYGLLMSMVGVGSLLGSMVIASIGQFRRRGLLLLGLGLAWGLSLVAFSFSTSMAVAIPLLLLLGLASIGCNTLDHVLVQILVDDEMRGRVLSIYALTFGINAAGTFPVSWVAETLGTDKALMWSGLVLCLFGGVVGLWRRDLRRLA